MADKSRTSAKKNVRNISPEKLYNDINESSIDRHFVGLSNNNLLRANARVKIYGKIFPFAPSSIADIGCGVGLTTKAFKQAYPRAAVYGYDSSESAILYAKREDASGANFGAIVAGADVSLGRKFDAMIFQEFYPFTRTSEFNIQMEFLHFMVNNLSSCGFAFIQLAIRHPEKTILNNLTQLAAFCDEHGLALSRHMIPFDRLVDVTHSVRLSSYLTPLLAAITRSDRRMVLMIQKTSLNQELA
jgi:SAM-dependent methyltransferase